MDRSVPGRSRRAAAARAETRGRAARVCSLAGLTLALVGAGASSSLAAPPSDRDDAAQAPAPGRPDLDALLARFAAMPGLYAEFREEKRLAMLAVPLVNVGTIHFSRGAFARHVVEPRPSSLVVTPGYLAFADARGREELDLRANPVAALFVESFTKILAGDREALAAMYRMELHPTGDGGWKLDLRPKVSPLSEVIEIVEVSGHGVRLDAMRIVEVEGDETLTTFTHVDPAHRYSRRERRRVFSARVDEAP